MILYVNAMSHVVTNCKQYPINLLISAYSIRRRCAAEIRINPKRLNFWWFLFIIVLGNMPAEIHILAYLFSSYDVHAVCDLRSI